MNSSAKDDCKPRPEYEIRIVLYMDILGWKDLILAPTSTEDLSEVLDALPHLANQIEGVRAQGSPVPFGIEAAYFSDSLVVSGRDEEGAVRAIFDLAGDLANELLGRPAWMGGRLLCRGAIVKGQLYHRGNSLFGPALQEAHRRESSLAVYPRILVANDLIDSGAPKAWTKRDADYFYFLDIFSIRLQGPKKMDRAFLREIRRNIESGLQEYRSDLRKRMKWMWLARYFNDLAAERPLLNIHPIELD